MTFRTLLLIAAVLTSATCAEAQQVYRTYLVRVRAGSAPEQPAAGPPLMRINLLRSFQPEGVSPLAGGARDAAGCLQEVTRRLEGARRGHRGFRVLRLARGLRVTCTAKMARDLQADPNVENVVLDPFLAMSLPDARTPATAGALGSWQLAASGLDTARASFGLTGEGVTVGLLDSGIVADGPFAGRIAAFRDFTSRPSDTPTDPEGHGSAVASVLAGALSGKNGGAAPGARLVVARVLEEIELPGEDGERRKVVGAFASRILEAMEWVMDPDGDPSTADAPRIVNNSWGFSDTGLLEADFFRPAVDTWVAAGILPVFSAGNQRDAVSRHTFFPASYEAAVAVGSVGVDRTLARFSASGRPGDPIQKPDLVAPGVSVVAWHPRRGYQPHDGTSFSAPLVSGAAALLLQAWPELEAGELRQLLTASAADLGQRGPDRGYGHGFLQAQAAGERLVELAKGKLASRKAPEEFLGAIEKLLDRQGLPLVSRILDEAAEAYAAGMSPEDLEGLQAVTGRTLSRARAFVLARVRDRQEATQVAAAR